MRASDLAGLVAESVASRPLRAGLTMLGVVVGIGAVVLLSAIGEGARTAIGDMFGAFGTTLVSVVPGKSETFGAAAGAMATTRKLTIDDALALRRVGGIRRMTFTVSGTARVEHRRLGRDVLVIGATHEASAVWTWDVAQGSFLPPGDPRAGAAVCVLGHELARELFGGANPIGAPVRVGEMRLRVVGVMEEKGEMMGIDLDDSAFVPLSRAMSLFDTDALHEINIDVASRAELDRVVARTTALLKSRHDGEEDFTIVTQAAMLETVDSVTGLLASGVVAVAAIALVVGAVGILTITWVSVHERTAEIGLLKAIGASDGQVVALLLGEAAMLAGIGGLVGVLAALAGCWGIARWRPELVHYPQAEVLVRYVLLSAAIGAVAGALPARKAARMTPIEALREE